jgi:rhodanese-related sulfurtransferase
MKLNTGPFSNRVGLLLACAVALALAVTADEPPAPAKPAPETKDAAGPSQKAAFRNVGVAEFAKLRAGGTNVVLDVRTSKEFQSGHIPGAVNLDFNGPDFKEKVKSLDKGKLYLVHCAAGVRSAKACKIMGGLDFTNLVNLEGGFRAWEKEGKPVEH